MIQATAKLAVFFLLDGNFRMPNPHLTAIMQKQLTERMQHYVNAIEWST